MAKRSKKDGAAASATTTSEEELSDGQLYSRTEDKRQEYERCLGAKKRADAEFKNCCKSITKLLGDGAIDDIKELIAGETPEGEAKLKASVERRLRVLRWMETPIGFHGELFPEIGAAPITERAFNAGRRHALAGEPRNNPHHHTTEASRSYDSGYEKGQGEKITAGIKPLDPEAADDIKKSASLGSSRPSFQVQ
jgi:hypothetical protein